MTCDLCILKRKTKQYYEGKDFTILDCDTCKIPMVVLRKHSMNPSEKTIGEMEKKIYEMFGVGATIRKQQRKIKNHLHWHIILATPPT